MASKNHPRLLTTHEVCAILQVTRTTLKNYRDAGNGPPVVKLAPRTVRYPSDELQDWINANRERE